MAMKDEYSLKWVDYRRLCKYGKYSLVALVTVPFALLLILGFLSRLGAPQFIDNLAIILFPIEVALMITTVYFAWGHYIWRCPRCGEPFGRFHEECQNCALLKWATENDCEFSREDVESGRAEWPRPRI